MTSKAVKSVKGGKLVRDNVPKRIQHDTGKKPEHIVLGHDELKAALLTKLSEETAELKEALASCNRSKIIEEMADVQEVLSAIKDVWEIDGARVIEQQLLKSSTHGSFKDKIFLLDQ